MADPVVFENAYAGWTTGTASATSSATGYPYTEIPGVKNISAPYSRAELDDAVMGDLAEAKYPGIIAAPVSLTCRQDFAAAGIDSAAYTRLYNRTVFRLKLRPVDAAVSSTNPSYVYTRVRVYAISPLEGAHGVALENKLEFRNSSGGTITRSTTT